MLLLRLRKILMLQQALRNLVNQKEFTQTHNAQANPQLLKLTQSTRPTEAIPTPSNPSPGQKSTPRSHTATIQTPRQSA